MGDDGSKNHADRKGGASMQPKETAVPSSARGADLLWSYYENPRMTAAALAKAANNLEVKSFDEAKEGVDQNRLDELDPKLARTLRLAGQSNTAITRWVEGATKSSIKRHMPGFTFENGDSPAKIFDKAVGSAMEDLRAKDRLRRTRSQNLLRLILVWRIESGNLDPVAALNSLKRIKRQEKTTVAAVVRNVKRLLRNANFPKLNDLATIARLFESELEARQREARQNYDSMVAMRERSGELETELEATRSETRSLSQRCERQAEEIDRLKKKISDDEEREILRDARAKAQRRVLLTERIRLPLSDARDALEMEPPRITAAQQRIEMAITAIDRETEKSDG